MKFLMLHYIDASLLDFSSEPDTSDPVMQELETWVTEMESAGVKLYGNRLRPAQETVTMRIRGGNRLLTDGPFAETKELIAGFDVLECDSLEAAIEVAARHPTARFGTLELRQFLGS